jgi:hypothetical protein
MEEKAAHFIVASRQRERERPVPPKTFQGPFKDTCDPPASAFWVLELQLCTTTPCLHYFLGKRDATEASNTCRRAL